MCAIRVLSFFADGDGFAADVAFVQKIARKIKITPVPAAPREVAGIANLKGKVVTILNTAALLNLKRQDGAWGAWRGPRTANAVIFKPGADDGGQMGLLMDRPGDLAEIDENTAAPPLTDVHISEVYESGGIRYRIIDIESIIGRFRDGGGCYAAGAQRGGTVDEGNA